MDTVGKVASDIGTGITEVPRAVAKGVTGAVNEVFDATAPAAKWLEEKTGLTKALTGQDPTFDNGVFRDMADPQSVTGNLVKDVSKFLTGFVGGMRIVKAASGGAAVSTAGKFAQASAAGAISDAAVFKGTEERLSNLLIQYPMLDNSVTQYLAAKPDDGEAEGRFKNALEGLLLGGVTEGVFLGAKALKALRRGDTAAAEALSAEAETVAKKLETEPVQGSLNLEGGGPKPDSIHEQVRPGVQTDAGKSKPTDLTREGAVTAPKPFMAPEKVQELRENVKRMYTVGGEDMTVHGQDFNFSNFTSSEDVRAAINTMSATIDEEIRKVKGGNSEGIRNWQTVQRNSDRLAEQVGEDPMIMFNKLRDDARDMKFMDSKVLAYRTFLNSITDKTLAIARLYNANKPGVFGTMEELERNLVHHVQLWGETQALFKGVQTNIARSLNAMKLPAGTDLKMVLGTDLQTMAKQLVMAADDPAAAGKIVRGSLGNKLWNTHNEYWINAMLSNPKTWAANFLGNTARMLLDPAENAIAGAINGDKGQVLDGFLTYAGYMMNAVDSIRMAGKSLRLGEAVLDPHVSFLDGTPQHAISSSYWGVKPGLGANMIDGVGQFVNIPSRAMIGIDEFSKQLTYRGNLWGSFVREAWDKGIRGRDALDYAGSKLEQAFDGTGRGLDDRAMKIARDTTFQQPLEAGSFSSWMQNGTNKFAPLKIIAPFVRTPANIMAYLWDRTPGINMLHKQMQQDFLAGGERRASVLAKTATGGALWTAGFGLALNGSITGNGPADPNVRKTKLETGWKPYSIREVDPETGKVTYTPYNKADPISMFMGLAADIVEIGPHMSDMEFEKLALAATTALAHNLNNKSYLQGITNAVQAWAQPDKKVEKWWEGYVSSYVPAAAAAFKDDPYMREVRSTVDAIKAKTPGLSETLDPVRNMLGEKIALPSGHGIDAINPFYGSEWKNDAVYDELSRLAEINKTGFQPPAKKWGDFDLTQAKVGPNQTAYDRLQELIGTVKDSRGRTVKDTLEERILGNDWSKLTDGGETYDGSRMMTIKAILGGYRHMAEGALIKENEDLQSHYMAHQFNRAQALKVQQ